MAHASVEGEAPPGQDAEEVPLRMRFIGEWREDGVSFELYVDPAQADGWLLALHRKPWVCAGTIADANDAFDMVWTGGLDRSASFLEAQAATAAGMYREHRS